MKVLIIGNGGREHAIGWKLKQDNPTISLYFAKGNGGTAQLGENLPSHTIEELIDFADKHQIDLTVVGSEELLVEGIVDAFHKKNLRILGPGKKAALLEGSKDFAKNFMQKYGVKTANSKTFNNYSEAVEYIKTQKFPLVVKADGLASGKGVIICYDEFEAVKSLKDILNKRIFGDAGNHVIIEEYLEGFETSILSIFNGKEITPFISAKDHKKINDGETGANTGGMGVIAPNPLFTEVHYNLFMKDILEPTLKGLLNENLIFSGIIFFGLMINQNGVYLLEYNMRMGDPETQAVLPLLENNLLDVIDKAINKKAINLKWKNQQSVCVVMASGGYPFNYDKGFEISGLEKINCPYFIAGANYNNEKYYTSGGRVLNIVGLGNNLEEARNIAYKNITKIKFDYEYYRHDIGEI